MARIRNIYLFKTDGNMYKIGVADHPKKRLKGVQTGCPTKVKIVFTMPTYKALKVEAELHEVFKENRMIGEWFSFTDDESEEAILQIRKRTIKTKHQVDLSNIDINIPDEKYKQKRLVKIVKKNKDRMKRYRSYIEHLKEKDATANT